MEAALTDNVNNPAHYQFSNGAQVIDITENMNFNLGNVIKYVARAGRKDADKLVEDLEKAKFYLERELARLNEEYRTEILNRNMWTVDAFLAERAEMWESRTPPREWALLDHVPPNTIVEDKDGDRYRRIVGTAKFEISVKETTHGQYYEWQALWPFFYKEQDYYGPFTEVKE